MAYALFVLGVTGGGAASGWLAWADVEAHDGRGDARLTADLDDALQFPTAEAALAFWRQASTTRPTRPDGKPNRPLTAFSIELVDLER